MLHVAEEPVASTLATGSVPTGGGFDAQFDRLVGYWAKERVPHELGAAPLLERLPAGTAVGD